MNRTLRIALIVGSLALLPAFAAAQSTVPEVTITAPEEGVTLASETVSIEVSYAGEGDAAVEQVDLVVDGLIVATRLVDPPETAGVASFTWIARKYDAGEHRLAARAYSASGAAGEAEIAVWLERSLPDLSGAVRIISPKQGDAVAGRTTIQVAAEQPTLVRYVIFLIDDVFKAMSNVRPYQYAWDTTRYLNGLHRIQVKAYLSGDLETLSPQVEVRVDNPGGRTTMRAPEPRAATPVAPEPQERPLRAGQPVLPAPKHTESATPVTPSLTVSDLRVVLPGTAPYVSESGDLIHPREPGRPPIVASAQPMEIAALPAALAAASAPRAGSPAPMAIAGVPQAETADIATPEPTPAIAPATHTAADDPVTPASERASAARAPHEPAAAPIEVALLPEPAPAPAAPVLPAEHTAAPTWTTDAHTEAHAAAIEVTPGAPSTIDVAMLPPMPVEPMPAPKLAPEPAPGPVLYVVQRGDYLKAIAARYGVTATEIARANNITDPRLLLPGRKLRIPTAPVYFDGRPLASDAPTVIAKGRATVSLRAVVEHAGGTIGWEGERKRATADARGHRVAVTIGDEVADVDGKDVAMGAPAKLWCDRTVVPLRFLGDALDLVLQYQDGIIRIASAR